MLVWLLILLAVTGLHLFASPRVRTWRGFVETLLLYIFLINVGLMDLWSFFGNVFHPDETAKMLGFGPGSPFQQEVGIAGLAFGVLGLLCVFERGGFWLATALGYSVFIFGKGMVHAVDIATNRNLDILDSGAELWFNLLFPIAFLSLLMIHRRWRT